MTNELKPCPFCGGEADPEGWMSLDSKGPACDDCGASANSANAWNTRAVPDVPELERYDPDMETNTNDIGDWDNSPTMSVSESGDYVRYDQAVAVIAKGDAEIERVTKSRNEAWQSEQKWKDRYNREVHGLNNEGDPIGGDPAYGLKQRAEAAEAKLDQIEKQELIGYVPDFIVTSLVNSDGVSCYIETKTENFRPEYSYISLYAAPVASDADLRAKLSDPTAILINMMRGEIAKPEFDSLQRIYPEIADLRAENEDLRGHAARIIAAFDEENDLDNPEKFNAYFDLKAALNPSEPRT